MLFFASSHYVQNVFGLLKTCSCRCHVQAGCAEISQREDIKARLVWFQLHREFLLRLISEWMMQLIYPELFIPEQLLIEIHSYVHIS